ncbi:MAG: MerR family transcriptional regulator [Granulosicoccus sp.]
MEKNSSAVESLTPAQMTDVTGVSIETLRYYEREGLLQAVERASSGHRRYSSADVLWVQVLRCLRDTGMTIEQLRTYCKMGEQGDHTEPDRLALLLNHKRKVESDIIQMQASLELIDHKIGFYQNSIKQGKQS